VDGTVFRFPQQRPDFKRSFSVHMLAANLSRQLERSARLEGTKGKRNYPHTRGSSGYLSPLLPTAPVLRKKQVWETGIGVAQTPTRAVSLVGVWACFVPNSKNRETARFSKYQAGRATGNIEPAQRGKGVAFESKLGHTRGRAPRPRPSTRSDWMAMGECALEECPAPMGRASRKPGWVALALHVYWRAAEGQARPFSPNGEQMGRGVYGWNKFVSWF